MKMACIWDSELIQLVQPRYQPKESVIRPGPEEGSSKTAWEVLSKRSLQLGGREREGGESYCTRGVVQKFDEKRSYEIWMNLLII